MNVPTMTMPKKEARARLREYKRQLERSHDDELRAVAEGLRWMARGRAVINLIPDRLDRLAALGNAVVPQVAEFIGRRLMVASQEEGGVAR